MKCTCPYCDKKMDDDPEDCYEPNECYEWECLNCGKLFVFYVEYERIYREIKADCLNGGEHDYQRTCTYPPEFAKARCTICQKEIEP